MPRLMARSMVSFGIFCALASFTAFRRRAFESTSPLPPVRAATVISLMSLVKILPRFASRAPFLCLIVCHFECPDIDPSLREMTGQQGPCSPLISNLQYTTLQTAFQKLVDTGVTQSTDADLLHSGCFARQQLDVPFRYIEVP